MKRTKINLSLCVAIFCGTLPILIVGCEQSREYSSLYKQPNGENIPNLTPDQIQAQKWQGAAVQIDQFKPVAEIAGPVTGGIAPLAVSTAGGVVSLVALYFANRAKKANKTPGSNV